MTKAKRKRPQKRRVADTPEKPAYLVPTMREVRELEPCGLTVASTFSGAGGSCLGYRMAGCRVLWANEFTDASGWIYRVNFPETILDTRDVRKIKPEEILEAAGLGRGELDVLDGSPPCDSFSTIGRREKKWGDTKAYSGGVRQRTDDLFFEYARLLEGLQPRAFVAENVRGLVVGTAKGYFLEILKRLEGCGYRVKARVLEAQWLGVPQVRRRVIFVGFREDLDLEPVHPSPLPWTYATREACPWIQSVVHDNGSKNPSWAKMAKGEFAHLPAPTIVASAPTEYRVERERPMTSQEASRMRGHEVIPLGRGRRLSIPEARRLCSFPDDFNMECPYKNSWRALGMSVPPLMMRAVAREVRDRLLSCGTASEAAA